MSYARNLLSRGEEVVFESRQHWFAVVAQTWIFIIVAIVAVAILIWVAAGDLGTAGNYLAILALIGLLVGAVQIALKVWGWRNQEYLITSRRVVKAQGILNKSMGDSSLEKVNDAQLRQSLVGRIFGYGDLDILTASDAAESGQINDFPMIADPVQFKISMLNAKERLERPDLAPPPSRRPAPPPEMRPEAQPPRAGSDRVSEVPPEPMATSSGPAPAPAEPAPAPPAAHAASPASPADELATTLERLAGLRDKGLITPDEYEAKKRDLLERM